MINLFDSYTQSSWDLHFSLIKSGYINPTIALNDDGFLPDDVTSPYLYYTGFAKTGAYFAHFTTMNLEFLIHGKLLVLVVVLILLT